MKHTHTHISKTEFVTSFFDVNMSSFDLYILQKYLFIPLLVLCIPILGGPTLQCVSLFFNVDTLCWTDTAVILFFLRYIVRLFFIVLTSGNRIAVLSIYCTKQILCIIFTRCYSNTGAKFKPSVYCKFFSYLILQLIHYYAIQRGQLPFCYKLSTYLHVEYCTKRKYYTL